jgi:hypothetical protein
VAAAGDDLRLLDDLEGGKGKTARKVLEYAGEGAGAILGGLTFGGAALGKITGSIAGAATRPASAIRMVARARGALDAVRSRQGAAVKAFAELADKGAEAAKKGARRSAAAARRVAPTVARRKRQERVQRLTDTIRRVTTLGGDPMAVADAMERPTEALRMAAPGVADAVVAGAARAAAYLRSVAPQIYEPPFGGDVAMVDPFALDEFEQRLEAVEDPWGTLERLRTGTLTREHVEALQAVYPRVYEQLVGDVMEVVGTRSNENKPVSFQARTALSLLTGQPLDDSLRPGDRRHRRKEHPRSRRR